MPNRWIKESCRSSTNLSQVSDMAERLFWRLITTADDFGRFIADADVVKGVCFSKIARIRIADVHKCVQMLADANLLKLYTIDDRLYGYFVNWEKHQGPGRAIKSKYPEPVEKSIEPVDSKQMQTDASGCEAVSNIPALLPKTKTKTKTKTDLSLSSLHSLNSLNSEEDTFHEFWEAYPKRNGKKIGKGRAVELFNTLSAEDGRLCIQAAQHYGQSERAQNGFVRDADRFIRDDYWREWIEPETPQAPSQKAKPLTAFGRVMQTIATLEEAEGG